MGIMVTIIDGRTGRDPSTVNNNRGEILTTLDSDNR
jgi:hypothetical protein